uniref:Glutamine--fructose-6-phosphate transaminase (isomerizing) n=1 Tax=Heterorhabditis bacteriophora TaxID=37862 RepID=A0A1I7XRF6_HETBA
MSGELKHGPLAMVDENLRICMVICNDSVYKCCSQKDLAGMKHILRVPKTVDCVQNVLTVIPLQLLSYHIAELNGQNVDRPRNLAKSVTVE